MDAMTVIVAVGAFLAGQFLPRNWADRLREWRDRVEGRAGGVDLESMPREDLVAAIMARPDWVALIRDLGEQARQVAEEVRKGK